MSRFSAPLSSKASDLAVPLAPAGRRAAPRVLPSLLAAARLPAGAKFRSTPAEAVPMARTLRTYPDGTWLGSTRPCVYFDVRSEGLALTLTALGGSSSDRFDAVVTVWACEGSGAGRETERAAWRQVGRKYRCAVCVGRDHAHRVGRDAKAGHAAECPSHLRSHIRRHGDEIEGD